MPARDGAVGARYAPERGPISLNRIAAPGPRLRMIFSGKQAASAITSGTGIFGIMRWWGEFDIRVPVAARFALKYQIQKLHQNQELASGPCDCDMCPGEGRQGKANAGIGPPERHPRRSKRPLDDRHLASPFQGKEFVRAIRH
jgi:hypothetical protein